MLSKRAFDFATEIGQQSGPILIDLSDAYHEGHLVEGCHRELFDATLVSCLKSQELELCSWMPWLLIADPATEDGSPTSLSPHAADASKNFGEWIKCRGTDTELLSAELTASYEAVSAALLPQYRQRQLTCRFDIGNGFATIATDADYSPMGQQAFFFIASRLLLQRLLVGRNIQLPVLITEAYLGCLDADWGFAIWRLILSANGPVIVTLGRNTLGDDVSQMLGWVDWEFPSNIRRIGVQVESGTIDLIETVFEAGGDKQIPQNETRPVPDFLKRDLD